jgi:diaminopimelate epimerase
VRRGLSERRAELLLDGGTLLIEWREADFHVLMTGPVETSFSGSIDLDAYAPAESLAA